jgi:uncharacterized protein YbjT (DUF2867 family)
MKILAVGATGVLGRHVVPRLVERGHKVKAIVRRHEQAQFVQMVGAEPIIGDIFDKDSLNDAARGCMLLSILPLLFPDPGARTGVAMTAFGMRERAIS